MSGDFLGTFENSCNKDRVVIPAPFKAKFSAAAKQTVLCTIGPDNDSIAIYPLDNWFKLQDKLKNGSDDDKDLLDKLMFYASHEQVLEGPGRIRITNKLQKIGNIRDKVVIQGFGSYMLLWDEDRFNEKSESILKKENKFSSRNYQV